MNERTGDDAYQSFRHSRTDTEIKKMPFEIDFQQLDNPKKGNKKNGISKTFADEGFFFQRVEMLSCKGKTTDYI